MKQKFLAITGVARSGKDSTFNIIRKLLPERSIVHLAFASTLKRAAYQLLKENLNIDVFSCTPEEKELVRPILVELGVAARKKNPRHWIDKLQKMIEACCISTNPYLDDSIVCITDLRFDEQKGDEYDYVKNELGATVIHVERLLLKEMALPPANEHEAINDIKLKQKADIRLSASNLEELEEQIKEKVIPIL